MGPPSRRGVLQGGTQGSGSGPPLHDIPWPEHFVVVGALLAAALLGSACARTPPPPQPAPNPVTSTRPTAIRPAAPAVVRNPPRPSIAKAAPSAGVVKADPILSSASSTHGSIEDGVQWWLNHWQNRGRVFVERGLARMGRYEDYIDAEIAARDLPPSLRYLPLIEANYSATAVSRAGAGGLWQFMPETAKWLGLEVGSLVDRRFDPYAATPLALEYLTALHSQFGSWFLALAAYNGGPGRVERAIQRYGGGRPRDDALFVHIRDRLPRETRDFIPKYLAAVRLAQSPGSFGLSVPPREPPERFDVVQVDGAASADVLAEAAGVAEDEMRILNPHLRMGLTPADKATELRVPPGTGEAFRARLADIPPGDRVTLREHTVVRGETLGHIARQYRVSLDALRAANPAVEPRRMQIGTVLVIPRPPGR